MVSPIWRIFNWRPVVSSPAFRSLAISVLSEFRKLEGWERFEAAQAGGRGVLLVTLHLGNWELGGPILTLVLPPLLIVALALTAVVTAFVVYDGESIWLEGLALIGLYCIIAAVFWWG